MKINKINIIFTGPTSFLGINVLKKISNYKNYNLILLVRNVTDLKKLNFLKRKKNILIFNYEKFSINNLFKERYITGVIHCATNYGLKETSAQKIIKSNLLFPLLLLDNCKKNNTKFFINTDTIINKNISSYSLSKYQFVNWLKSYSKKIFTCNIKLEHFYGPGDDDSKFVINIIKKILKKEYMINFTKGDQYRDFIYIDDVVSAFDKIIKYCLKTKSAKFEEFEVGTGNSTKIKSIVKLISKYCNNKLTKLNFGALKYRRGEKIKIKLRLKKLKKLNWKPKWQLRKGIKKTIKFYK